MKFDWLVVGAGFTGATLAERIASQLNQKVLLIDRRGHVGGNAFDLHNEHGVLYHQYGPHIFHTNSQKVWDYLSRFTEWRPYEHHVLAVVDGKKVPIPFNLNTIEAIFPSAQAERLGRLLVDQYGFGAKVPILKMRENGDRELAELAEFIYQNIFYNYTVKQWGLKPDELDPLVTGRVPVSISRDNRYFQDTYQAMPKDGYSEMFKRMLDHPNIAVETGADYRQVRDTVKFDRMIFTGPLDEHFDYMHGPLPYRSLRFEFSTLDSEWFQEVGTVNYPNDNAYTRITEQKHITGQQMEKTTIVVEYPQNHVPRENEPYYPIPREENRELYNKYLSEAAKLDGSVLFAGRLADYKYYNMDQAAARALKLFEDEVAAR